MNVRRALSLGLLTALSLTACSARDAPPDAPAEDAADASAPDPTPPIVPTRAPSGVHLTNATLAPAAPDAGGPPNAAYHNGAVLSNAHVIPVFWGANVDAVVKREIHCFYSAVLRSPYMDWLSEFNTPTQAIGRGSVGAAVTITPTHTGTAINDADIQSELAAQIDNHVLPAADANSLYMIYFPPGVVIDGGGIGKSCVKFCAYHSAFGHSSTSIRYGVMPDLASGGCQNGCGGGTTFENVGSVSSHELIEAVTDPDVSGGWWNSDGKEIGDVCVAQEVKLPGTAYTVQQMWSNTRGACFAPTTGTAVTEPAVLDSITPASGAAEGPSTFTVNGSCFSNESITVTKGVGTTYVTPTVTTPNALTVTVPGSPDGQVGVGTVTVRNADKSVVGQAPYTFVPGAEVYFSPQVGPMQGDLGIELFGAGFRTGSGTVTALFGSTPMTAPSSCDSSTHCVLSPPAHDPGPVDVKIFVDGVTVPVLNGFTYLGPEITRVTPSAGPITGGTAVTIHGVNMGATSSDTFRASVSLGALSLGDVTCFRENAHDGSCDVTTPSVAAPTGPLDFRLTIASASGTKVQTVPVFADHFTYRAMPALTSLSFLTSASGGQSEDGRIQIDGNAPQGGAVVSLALGAGAPAGVVQFPSQVTIPAGQSSIAFPVLVTNQNFTGDVRIVASYAGTVASTALRVYPTPAPSVSALPTLCPSQTATATITLGEPAPPGGGVAHLTLDSNAATAPATVTIPAGATAATFTVTSAPPAAATDAHLVVDYYGVKSAPVAFRVLPSSGFAVALPSSVTGGLIAGGTITLCSAAPPMGAPITFTSSSALATPPASITLPAGSTSGSFSIATHTTPTVESATIGVTYQGSTVTSTLVLRASVAPPPPTCPSGQTLCTCAGGAHTCTTTSMQCFTFCQKNQAFKSP